MIKPNDSFYNSPYFVEVPANRIKVIAPGIGAPKIWDFNLSQ
jgi:hypothetical protein